MILLFILSSFYIFDIIKWLILIILFQVLKTFDSKILEINIGHNAYFLFAIGMMKVMQKNHYSYLKL